MAAAHKVVGATSLALGLSSGGRALTSSGTRGRAALQEPHITWLSRLPLLLAAGCRAALQWSSHERLLATLSPDDAYYYFGVARAVASGRGSTFDGVTPTNGYQPLWLVVCACIARFAGVTLERSETWALLPRLAISVQVVCGLLAVHVIARTTQRALGAPLAARWSWLLACDPYTVYAMCDGTEGGLVLLLCALVLSQLVQHGPALSTRQAAVLAVLLSAAALARLDLSLLIVLCLLSCQTTYGRRAYLVAVPTCALGSYALYNATHFDTIVPIGAWLKDAFPQPREHALALATAVPGAGGNHHVPNHHGFVCTQHTYSGRLGVGTSPRGGIHDLHWIHTLLFMRGDVWK